MGMLSLPCISAGSTRVVAMSKVMPGMVWDRVLKLYRELWDGVGGSAGLLHVVGIELGFLVVELRDFLRGGYQGDVEHLLGHVRTLRWAVPRARRFLDELESLLGEVEGVVAGVDRGGESQG